MSKQKIRIRLKAYDHQVLDQSAERIVDTAKRTGAFVSGPVPLPTEINRFCVNRSPHVDKKSREHFEMRTHKRLIDILQASPKTMDALMHLDLPAGVDIELKGVTPNVAAPVAGVCEDARRSGAARLFILWRGCSRSRLVGRRPLAGRLGERGACELCK